MNINKIAQEVVTLGELSREICTIFARKEIYMHPQYLTHRARQFGIKGIAKIENGDEKNRGIWITNRDTAALIRMHAHESTDIGHFYGLLCKVR